MGLFEGNLPEEKQKYEKQEKKNHVVGKKKGIVSLIIKDKKVIVDVGGNGEEIKYDEREHGSLKIGDPITF